MDVEFEDTEFENLICNVYPLGPRESVLKRFPKLAVFPEFHIKVKGLDRNKIIKYIVLMYDMNTPLKRIDNIQKRKYTAGKISYFPTDEEGKFREHYEEIMNGKSFTVNQMIFRYLKFHRNPDYSFLVSLEDSYYTNLTKMMGGDNSAYSIVKNQKDDLTRATSEFLNQDDQGVLKESLYEHIDMDNMGIRPEDVAEALSKHEDPFPEIDPYKLKKHV